MPYYLVNINSYMFSVLFFLLKNTVLSDVRLRRMVSSNIIQKVDILCCQGLRHKLGLPFMVNVHVQMHVHNALLVTTHV